MAYYNVTIGSETVYKVPASSPEAAVKRAFVTIPERLIVLNKDCQLQIVSVKVRELTL